MEVPCFTAHHDFVHIAWSSSRAMSTFWGGCQVFWTSSPGLTALKARRVMDPTNEPLVFPTLVASLSFSLFPSFSVWLVPFQMERLLLLLSVTVRANGHSHHQGIPGILRSWDDFLFSVLRPVLLALLVLLLLRGSFLIGSAHIITGPCGVIVRDFSPTAIIDEDRPPTIGGRVNENLFFRPISAMVQSRSIPSLPFHLCDESRLR